MELALIIANTLISIAALVVALRKRADAREAALERIVTDAIAAAKAQPQSGIPTERVALQWAIIGDTKDNGKRDFTDGQLLVAIRARLA